MASVTNIGVSALQAFQRAMTTTGHNIANSETEGYSRQRVEFATQPPQLRGTQWQGSGVKVASVERQYDQFLSAQVRTSQSTTSQLETFFNQASRIDNLLADPDIGLDPAIQGLFDSMQALANDPTSTATRQVLMLQAQSLSDRFHDLNGEFDEVRRQINNELDATVTEINGLAENIAGINRIIAQAVGSAQGGSPNDLLDERDRLIDELSKRVSVSLVEQEDGMTNVFIGNGQALVTGVRASTLAVQPNSADAATMEVTFTDTAGNQQVITSHISGGQVGGLLMFRDQVLDSGQNQLGLLAVGISEQLNAQHRLGLDLDGNAGLDLFTAPTAQVLADNTNAGTATVSAAYVNSAHLSSSDYLLEFVGGANDTYRVTRLNDGTVTTFNALPSGYPYTSAEIDGFNLTISSGAVAGDSYQVRPTRAGGANFGLNISDGRQLAAASPLRAASSTNAVTLQANSGTGAISQPANSNTNNLPLTGSITLEFDPDALGAGVPGFLVTGGPGGTLAYNPATESAGKSFSLSGYGGASFQISGSPDDGDRFVIENNTSGVGDNRNALALAALQGANTLLGDDGAPAVAPTASFQEVYGQLVSDIGSLTHNAEANFKSQEGLLQQHQSSLASVSGVNLDEEAANLIRYQQAYQAAAQVISVSRTLFDTLLGAVGR